ncbi:DNA modification methylase [Zhihengliuella halotolerans]|uniref:DNA modification methylase n=1 Tax=Zhihengliuella halotolerans TaxID=370736 RepID=UPI001CA492C3|nr:DNA methyltransferase [Zhihengliuella halotolerans]
MNSIPATLDKLRVPIDGLTHYSKNARRGDLTVIKESLEQHGQYRPVVVRTGSNEILAGNHTVMAARELGWTHVAATFVDVDDDQAARIVLVDNRANDVADYDDTALAELLASLDGDFTGTGYTDTDYDDLLDALNDADLADNDTDLLGDPDDAPEPPVEPLSRLGDVIQLGRHRVICGDSTDSAVLAQLMAGDQAACMWTDPPYGVEYEGKTDEALTIQNDGAEDLDALLAGAFVAALTTLRPGAPCYVAHSDTRRISFETALTGAGFLVRQNLVWVKNTLVMGRSDYHYKHEPILYAFAPGGAGRLGRGGDRWYGDHKQTTVIDVDKPARNGMHPTMKPTELVLTNLRNSLKRGGIVLDPFGGSGSTLVAAHQHGSSARLVELDPRYVDVICLRYQQLTGDMPVRDGEPTDFGAADR